MTALAFLKKKLDELDAAEKEAAKGPWFYDCGNGQIESANKSEWRMPICDRVNTWDIGERSGEYIPNAEETCEFIAEARNAFPGWIIAMRLFIKHCEQENQWEDKQAIEQAARAMGW